MPELERKTITIEKILVKTSTNNATYLVLRSEGIGYFIWDDELIGEINDFVKEGDTIEIQYTPGKNPRVKNFIPRTGPPTERKTVDNLNHDTEKRHPDIAPKPATDRDVFIAKSVALKEAVKSYGPIYDNDDVTLYRDRVCLLADLYTDWILKKQEVD